MHVITENEARNLAQRIERGGKLNVPPNTILTPMARDYLRGRGIDIVDGEHAPKKSAPAGNDDALVEAVAQEVSRVLGESARGKVAATSKATPPIEAAAAALKDAKPVQRAVVWGIGGDRPGILADVAELLKKRQINILEISQTILSGVFAMVVIVDIANATGQFAEFKSELEALGQRLGVNLSAQRDDLFQFMHRI
jgi:ACT domain-containing protein